MYLEIELKASYFYSTLTPPNVAISVTVRQIRSFCYKGSTVKDQGVAYGITKNIYLVFV